MAYPRLPAVLNNFYARFCNQCPSADLETHKPMACFATSELRKPFCQMNGQSMGAR